MHVRRHAVLRLDGFPAACLFVSKTVIDNGGAGFGDQASCAALCNCNADCTTPLLVCHPWLREERLLR